jgi:hypothetical protein
MCQSFQKIQHNLQGQIIELQIAMDKALLQNEIILRFLDFLSLGELIQCMCKSIQKIQQNFLDIFG